MKMRRILCAALVILMLPIWVISCGKDPNTDVPETDVGQKEAENFHNADGRIALVLDGAPVYSIIRPDGSGAKLSKASSDILNAVKAKCGVELGIGDDWIAKGTAPDSSAKEILIGATNRPESAEVMNTLSESNFGIKTVGNKIVITAKKEYDIERAVEYFIDKYIKNVPALDGKLTVDGNIDYKSSSEYVTLASAGNNNYMVTYPSSEKDYCIWTYTPGDNLESFANTIYTKLIDNKKNSLALSSDKLILATLDPSKWNEVLVGGTTRPQTAEVKATLGFDDYAIKVVDNKVVVTGLGHTQTKEAVNTFIELLDLYRDNGTGAFRLPSDFAYTGKYTGAKNWDLAIPEYRDGTLDSVTDASENSYVAVIKDTSKEGYDEYLSELENEGYTKYSENTIGENFFAIYQNEKHILNVSYTTCDTSVRIVMEKAGSVVLPPRAVDNIYTDKGVAPTITQMFINHFEKNGSANNGGQCYIFELSDGRYIVVDGGPNGTEKGKDDAQNLYELLYKLSGGEKPVIAAWFITHLHNDHVTTFCDFSQRYNDSVTVENVIYNVPLPEMCNGLTAGVINEFNKAVARYAGAKKIKTHTGQKFFYANAEIDMILAQDLVYPNYVQFYNDTSLTFMVKMAGQDILITGDLSPNTAPILSRMYGTALQCDILQIAHHGSMGPDVEFYKLCNPTELALLPMGKGQMARLTSQAENVYIAKLVEIIPQYTGTKTFALPYHKK